jgi:PAS domain S-box-containing protein
VWLLNNEGRIVYDSEGLLTGAMLFHRAFFQHHLTQDNLTQDKSAIHIGMPQPHTKTGRWVVPASMAMRNNGFRGVAVAVIDIETFAALRGVHTQRENITISLLTTNGSVILRSPFVANEMGREELAIQHTSSLDDAGTADFRATSTIDGEYRLFSLGTIAGRPALRVLVGASEQRALSNWRRFAVGGLSLFLFISAGIFTLLYTVMRELRARIHLQQEAAELARYPLQNRNPVLTVSPLGEWLFANPAARELAGRLPPELQSHLTTQLRRLATEPGEHQQELMLGERTYQLSAKSTQDRYCDIYMTEITGLRENEALKNAFLAQPFMGMAVSDPVSHEWLLINERLCRMFGYSESELKSMDWRQLTPPEDLARETLYYESMLRGDTTGYTLTKRVARKDGTVIHIELHAHLLRRTDGSPYLIVAAAKDISERVQAQAAQQQLLHDLQERVKELHCVGRIATLLRAQLSRDDMLAAAAELLPPAWQYPDMTGARIRFDGKNYTTAGFSETPWRQIATIRVNGQPRGLIEVSYSAPQPDMPGGEGPFLKEERALIDNISEALGSDIARGEAEAALATANQRWQYALESGEHGVWEWHPDSDTVFFSPQWKAMLGFADHEIGHTLDEWTTRVHPEDLARAEAEIERHVRGQTDLYQSEHRLRHKDGHYLWILDRGRIVERDAAGKPLLMIGTHTDVTARKQIEIALLESEARFKGLVEQSLVGLYIIDDRKIHYANPRMCEIFGYTPEEMRHLGPEDITLPEHRPTVRENIRKRLSGEVPSIQYRTAGLRKDGSRIDTEVFGSVTTLNGKKMIIGVLLDITDKLRAEAQAASYVTRLEHSMMAAVEAISRMVDLRDPYTAGHERRVAEIAVMIGRAMGFDNDRLRGLQVAGAVHDIGKIAIPAEILAKPARLTTAEYDLVKTHAQEGYEILKDVDFPWPVAQTVWQHHERFDGSGYPRGLKGDDICLEARILAVADILESMASHRPYRPALGPEAAIREIQRQSGVQLDPNVVDVCLRLHRAGQLNVTDSAD